MAHFPRHLAPRPARALQGFSLVELMVAMVISLLIIASAIGLFVAQQASQRLTEQTLRPTEDRRLAADLITRDARSAGDYGCAKSTPVNNLLNNAAAISTGTRIRGFKYNTQNQTLTVDSTLPGAALVGQLNPLSDAVVFAGIYGALSPTSTTLSSSTAAVPLATSAAVATGDDVLISDCLQSTVFEVSANNSNSLTHTSGTTAYLGQGNSSGDLGRAYVAGSEVGRLDTIWYLIAAPTGRPQGLYRVSAAQNSAMLVSSLANQLHFNYGVDTTGSGVPSSTVDASGVSNWSSVVQLDVHLLLRSAKANSQSQAQSFYYNGSSQTATDNAFYAPLDLSVTLRNYP
jgi:type IV pilus assembly protein PilW